MSDLEELLRETARKGELNYLSVVPRHHKHGEPTTFAATFAPATNCAHSFGESTDPVEAIAEAIKTWKPVRRSRVTNEKALDFG